MKFTRLFVVGLVSSLLVYGGCGSSKKPPALEDGVGRHHYDAGFPVHHPVMTPDSSSGLTDATASTNGATDGGDAGHVYLAANCGALVCAGTKKCVQDSKGAYCDCDAGFIKHPTDPGEFQCDLDTSCVRLEPLYASCRLIIDGEPAVTSAFSVEYCGGVPVPPESVGNVGTAFSMIEDTRAPDPTESSLQAASVTPELYVTIALDVSGSVLSQPQTLSPLVGQLRNLVAHLAQPAGMPQVTFSVLVFAHTVEEYVAPTTNVMAVDAALQALETDPSKVTDIVQTNGTALYDAVARGIHATERLITLRDEVSRGGVYGSGELLVVTDGNNESGATTLDKTLVNQTFVHVVSVGISDQIDDRQLNDIGRDGSFLAPTPTDWQMAFDEIEARTLARQRSVYQVAYCTASTASTHQMKVQMANTPGASVGCAFNAGNFGIGTGLQTCKDYLTHLCDNIQPNDGVRHCGGWSLACGDECLPSECCNDFGECVAPTHDSNCMNQDELCDSGMHCIATKDAQNATTYTCHAPTPIGGNCAKVGCEAGVGECVAGTNDAGTPTKTCEELPPNPTNRCDLKGPDPVHQCATLNCALEPHSNLLDAYCQHPARMFDACAGSTAAAICETGTVCEATCKPRRHVSGCTTNEECLSGFCNTTKKLCVQTPSCHFSWADKVAQ